MPRFATSEDRQRIFELYKKVSQTPGGLARNNEEITKTYVDEFSDKAQANGLQLVVQHPTENNRIIAEIHCYKLEPKVFSHVLSELTIAVDPDFQKQGIGSTVFKALLNRITTERADILRVELIARDSNIKAINLYQQLGFVIEGRLEKRICNTSNLFEADIPMAWFNKNYRV